MTEEQAIELGRRAVAAGFRIMAGMLAISGERAGAVLHGRARWCPQHDDDRSVWDKLRDDDIPDFRDPATLGILRQQVLALVPGAVDVALARLFSATMPCTHSVIWRDNRGVTMRHMQFALTWDERWPIETLVACLEAAKKGEL